MSSGTTVAAVQLPAASGDPATDVAAAEAGVRAAIDAGAHLVVLPELAASPYLPAMPPERWARSWAEPVPGPLTRRLGDLARAGSAYVAVPLAQEDRGVVRNAVVLLGPDGSVLEQRDVAGGRHPVAHKLHLPWSERPGDRFDERAHFAPGNHLGTWRTGVGRVGALICFDRRFPETWRALRAQGVEVVVVPVAGSGGDTSDFFLAELRTHARENGVVVVAANKVGEEVAPDGSVTRHHGDSAVIDPYGGVLAHRPAADGPGVVLAAVPGGIVARARSEFPYFEQRRTDLFGGDAGAS